MTIETVHIPKTATLTIVLEGKEIDEVKFQIEILEDYLSALSKESSATIIIATLMNLLNAIRKDLKTQ